MKVSFHMETLEAAQQFRQRLEQLEKKVDLAEARYCILNHANVLGLKEEIYQEIVEVFNIRKEAITREMKAHGVTQAHLSNVELPEEVINGDSLNMSFPEYKETVPTSQVYELFMPYTPTDIRKQMQNLFK